MARFASPFALALVLALPSPARADAPTPTPPSPERVRRGVVTVSTPGKAPALGLVLPGDGRVVTALSALAGDGSVRLRYADGSTLDGRVAHRDARWDLALVVPSAKRWTDGLAASLEAPASSELRALSLGGPQGLSARLATYGGPSDATSDKGLPLPGAFRVPLAGATAGAPLVDGRGAVSGLVVRACKPAPTDRGRGGGGARPTACDPVLVVAPVEAVRAFVMATPATASIPGPWLGVAGVPEARGDARGVRIVAVAPKSPAAAAGVRGASDGTGDVVIRVDDRTTENPEQLAEAIAARAVGDRVTLHVVRQGKEKALLVTLKAAP